MVTVLYAMLRIVWLVICTAILPIIMGMILIVILMRYGYGDGGDVDDSIGDDDEYVLMRLVMLTLPMARCVC